MERHGKGKTEMKKFETKDEALQAINEAKNQKRARSGRVLTNGKEEFFAEVEFYMGGWTFFL